MKRLICFIGILFCLDTFNLFAESVSREEVHRQAVAACMRIAEEDFSTKAYTFTPMLEEGDTCYYVVQFEPEGWALISADDRVQPLIGYSDKGLFQKEEAPEAALFWLEKRAKEIQVIKSLKGLKRDLNWEAYSLRSDNKENIIKPLIKVNWNQDGDYAKYTPKTFKGEKTYVGCVAVAMGQAMTVSQYPQKPKGRFAYSIENIGHLEINYDEEPAYDWEKIMIGADRNDEVARLLYHCGLSVGMKYGPKTSSAHGDRVSDAFVRYFSYSKDSVKYYRKQYVTSSGTLQYISDDDWHRIIVNELKQKRPVIHTLGTLMHMANIDGYDGVDAYHFNMGWGGNGNGYYTFDEKIYQGKDKEYEDVYLEMIVGLIPEKNSSTNIQSVAQSLETPLQVVGSLLRLKSPEKGICRVYDLSGALLQTAPVVAGDNEIPLKTKGLCILSVDCNGKVASHKIHVKE